MPRINRLLINFLSAVVLCVISSTAAYADTFTVLSSATYIRTNQDPNAVGAMPINLKSLGVTAGDVITIEQLGAFGFCSVCDDMARSMIGVFSSTDVLLSSDQLNRVPGAIAVSGLPEFITSDTFYDALPTDIAADFEISNLDGSKSILSVAVPLGAQFLFVGTPDIFYGDNIDPNGDLAVRITTTAPIPEPTTMLLLGTGLAAIGGAARKRRQTKIN